MRDLKSHPNNRLLKSHLENVAEKCKEEILKKDLDLSLITKENLAEISYIIGICHDFGKATNSFQDFITALEKNPNSSLPHENHSFISSFIAYKVLKEFCDNSKSKDIFAWVGAFIIKNHHKDLNNFINIFEGITKDRELEHQLNELKSNQRIIDIYNEFLKKFNINFSEIIKSKIQDFDDRKVFSEIKKLQNEEKIELFLIIELLFSVLIDFDKKDAANILQITSQPIYFEDTLVDSYLNKKRFEEKEKFDLDKPLNKLKNNFYNQVLNNPLLKKENKIYTITAPTGIGKTLAVLSASIKLRNLIEKDYKIVYVLPFTSIIDQNYDIFEEVLKEKNKEKFKKDKSNFILKHHHLSNLNIEKENYISENYLNDLLIIQSWDSNVIVSTYIQLLMSIIGYKSSFLNKFHNVINSIIILDEVQFIGVKHWRLIKDFFNVLSKRFNSYLIFMTATQPLIFNENETKELSDLSFFDNPLIKNKIEYSVNKEKKSIDSFKKEFIEDFKIAKSNRILIILNTKNSSLEFYNFVKNVQKERKLFHGYKLVYLSTNILPVARKKIIDKIIKLQKKVDSKYIIITTQLIEAGVDISSDICYRDLAPLDSLYQSAGRCNRFNEISIGKFNILNLSDKNNKSYYGYVYTNTFEMNKALELVDLITNKKINAREHMQKYFNEIADNEHSNSLFDSIFKLDFSGIKEGFELIEEDYPTKTIFLENKDSQKLLKEFFEKLNNFKKGKNENKFKKLGEIKKVKIQMQKYTLEIKEKDFKFLLQNGFIKNFGNFYYIPIA